jgi:hypothetical protein
MIAKPPLIEEIERHDALLRDGLAEPMPDFLRLGALRKRRNELVSWARTNGWSTMPGDNTPTPSAPAIAAAA